ncbi:BRO family protein [Lachnoanaerobaculum saburreum]|uniref:BRO family protein n=1 Tax=Lachnoanaerobaculum saburreum TaxID=467210 RepID=A0A133ZSV3_9FIRM|nr:phage antirepressor KilAC domain-containing protein [Lachnoanaerobaculum saburreum]KXB58510.1 BRO family protein [Lachnoanaerobaculum saburreum]
MGELQIFKNEEFGEVRTVEIEGKPYFCGSDVAKALGYVRPNDAISTHCRATVKWSTPISGKMQDINYIPEGDLYRLIVSSKLPTAEKFERWVFDEVLPSIRKHGGYISGQTEMSPEELMAKALQVAQKTLEEREARIKTLTVQNSALIVEKQMLQPKADYFDELVDRNLLTNFRETAKELGIGQKDFVNFLISKKYVYRDKRGKLMPYSNKGQGLFEVKESYNEKSRWSGTQTLITPRGRETFRLLCAEA